MNEYEITFELPNGTRFGTVGVANNIPFAIENAKRKLAKAGADTRGLSFVRAKLIGKGV